jgi:hypothetical protein
MSRSPLLRNPFRSAVCALAAAVLLGLNAPQASAEHNLLEIATATITTDAVKKHIGVLADDTFEGREAGSRGGRAAGLYIVKQLEAAGVAPGGPKGSYYQTFGASYSNILGMLEGSDPELKQQVLILSAHYDHVGYGTARNSFGPVGLIHNGADDNASGVAAVLEVIEAFGKLPQHPKRSILFAFWDGEEKGLLGSEHWAGQPTLSLARVPLVINADMVGRLRDRRLEIFGSRTTQGLRRVFSSQNVEPSLAIDFSWEMKSNSDHYSFYKRRIPALLVHTGLHSDYHRPSDDAERINHDGVRQIAQWLFLITNELADSSTLGNFRERSQNESLATQQEAERPLTLPAGRLGLRWDPASVPGEGVLVKSVEPLSAAAQGGLRPGDRIVHFGDWDVASPEHFRAMVWAAKNPVLLRVLRAKEEPPVELTLTLPGNSSRLGITWRTDDAEPNVPVLNRVLPGSPADVAGLRVNDRVYRIAGREIASIDQFRELAAQLPGPLELTVESRGRLRTATLHPIDELIAPAATGGASEPAAGPESKSAQ